jgi:hypothetical protein
MKNTPNTLNMTLTSPICGVVMGKSGFERLSGAARFLPKNARPKQAKNRFNQHSFLFICKTCGSDNAKMAEYNGKKLSWALRDVIIGSSKAF